MDTWEGEAEKNTEAARPLQSQRQIEGYCNVKHVSMERPEPPPDFTGRAAAT